MSKYTTTQLVGIDFNFDSNLEELELTADDLLEINNQIMDAIAECNIENDVEISDMRVVEGLDYNQDLYDGWLSAADGFHILVECDIEIDGQNFDDIEGLYIPTKLMAQQLLNLYVIGEYIDISTLDLSIYPYDVDSLDYEEYEPDWDSMPGGHDYYD